MSALASPPHRSAAIHRRALNATRTIPEGSRTETEPLPVGLIERLTKLMGQNALKVVSRLMGLILAVIGTQMVIAGISGAVRHYASQ